MSVRRRFVIAFAAVLMLFQTWPGSIAGRVLDPDGRAMRDAEVTVSSGDSVTTGRDGRFAFPSLRPGHYDVTASKEGYETIRRRYVVESRRETDIEIKMVRKTGHH